MVITKSNVTPKCLVRLNGTEIKHVTQFNYLGSMIISGRRCKIDITSRTGMAKAPFLGTQSDAYK